MKKILDLNICICIVVTFLFEFLDGSNMIPSQYRLAIAAIILVFDAIFAIYAIIESRKKNHSIKMFLDDLNCKMKLELRNWDKGACPFIPIRVTAGPYSQFL